MGYSPILGRFLQRDPATFIDGLNLYEISLSNPVNRLDPSGNASLGWVAGTPAPDPGWQNNYPTINGPISGYFSGAINKDSGALGGVAFDQFQFGPDALKYISDNVNIAAITSKAFNSAQCGTTQTVSDKGQINLKVQRVGYMSNLTGGSVDADYQAVSTVTASPLCNGCCTVTIKTVLGANISKFYNFINKGWFFDATTEPIYIYGQILIQRSETRTLCP